MTDPERTEVSLWEDVNGENATRVTRMEAAAWIAVTKFGCTLEGGFVRDWVVGGYTMLPNPALKKSEWVTDADRGALVEDLVPADLDLHLPKAKEFNIQSLITEYQKIGLEVSYFNADGWRYVVIVDRYTDTGPFTLDLIEPHVAVTHDRLDFDVSNLSCRAGYTNSLGMRVIHPKLDLDVIVKHILEKKFIVCRHDNLNVREKKMVEVRGWKKIRENENFEYVPNRGHTAGASFDSIFPSSGLWKKIQTALNVVNGTVTKVEVISNKNLDDLYEALKAQIARENGGNPNEMKLFHGTKEQDAIVGIPECSFDNRFFSTGIFGKGAYFADDVTKCHHYNRRKNTNERVVFYSKVIMGKINDVGLAPSTSTHSKTTAPPPGYHSITGKYKQSYGAFNEYIVYRYGQAIPLARVYYTAP